MPKKPSPPPELGERALAFWRATLKTYELTANEVELLRELCATLDECDRLRTDLLRDGTTVEGSTGQPRPHPALPELRGARMVLSRLTRQLALPDPEAPPAAESPMTARKRSAANSRWSRVHELETRRGTSAS